MPIARDIDKGLERLKIDCQRLAAHRQLSRTAFLEDPAVREEASYLLCTTYQTALDIATALLGRLGLAEPEDETDVFALLAQEEVLSELCVSQLTAMHGLCTALAEQYEEIDPQWIYQTLQVNLAGLNQFVEQVQTFRDQ